MDHQLYEILQELTNKIDYLLISEYDWTINEHGKLQPPEPKETPEPSKIQKNTDNE